MENEMLYTEKIITIDDFEYDTIVRCKIPSLCVYNPILNKKDQIKTIKNNNILNKDLSVLDIGTCTVTNYINVFIPKIFSNDEKIGKSGTEFVVNFSGGLQNNIHVCGRCY